MWSDFYFRLRAIMTRRSMEEELDEELRAHLEHETAKLVASGLSHESASRAAQHAIGGLDQVKEDCRDARGVAWWDTTVADLAYSIRGMRRSPVHTLAALLTLGLGVGALSTVFTIANTLLFQALPVENPKQIVVVQATRRHGQALGWVGYSDYVRFRDSTRTLTGLAAHYSTAPLFVNVNDRAKEINGGVVSANFFPLLGLKPALGRFFSPDEDRVPDRDRVAVISHSFWRGWFGASPDAIGAIIKVNGVAFTVVGVTPEGFQGVNPQPVEFYLPAMMTGVGYRWCKDPFASDCTVFSMLGRLGDAFNTSQTAIEMSTLIPAEWRQAKDGENSGLTVLPARGLVDENRSRGSQQVRFLTLLGGVGCVLLLVCCVNLAGLLIARNTARVREFAIRSALGARSGRLIRQLMTESLVLGLGGGLIGLLVSAALTAGLNAAFFSFDGEGRPLHYSFVLSSPVILVVLGVAIGAGFLIGLVPALRTAKAAAAENLKRQSGSVTNGTPMASWLAGIQAGLAVALAVVAGLLLVSANGAMKGLNFEPSRVALMRLRPRLVQYEPEQAQRYVRTVIQALSKEPFVESVSMVGRGVVLLGDRSPVSVPDAPETQPIEVGYIQPGTRYFETLRIPLLAGREFDEKDLTQSVPVAIVNEALVRRLWSGHNALGETIGIKNVPHRIVGIVPDTLPHTRDQAAEPYVYTPFWQDRTLVDARLCIRVKGDPAAMLPALVEIASRVDRSVPVTESIPLRVQLAGVTRNLQITAAFISYAAALAIGLSVIGLYGSLAFAVSRRSKEIGIRMALGADRSEVFRSVVKEGMIPILAFVALGTGLAMASAQTLRHLLYDVVSGFDVAVYALVLFIVIATCLAACCVPARRATSVEPLRVLRED